MRFLLLAVVFSTGCASVSGRELQRIEPVDVTDAMKSAFAPHFEHVLAIWTIPGLPGHHLLFVEQPPRSGTEYGRQVVVMRGQEVVFQTRQMMDAEFFDPVFFRGHSRLLVLADFGAEDSWGLMGIDIGAERIRDLGTIDIARADDDGGFIASALPAARVFLQEGSYIVTFRGTVVDANTYEPLANPVRRIFK